MILLAIFILGIAARSHHHHVHSKHKKQKKDKYQQKGSYSCQLVQTILELTKYVILDNASNESKKFLTEKCQNITLLNKICHLITPDAITQLSQEFDKELDVKEFCKSIGVC